MVAATLTITYLNYQVSCYLRNQKQLEIDSYIAPNDQAYYAKFTWTEKANGKIYTETTDTTLDFEALRLRCEEIFKNADKDPSIKDIQYEILSVDCEKCNK